MCHGHITSRKESKCTTCGTEAIQLSIIGIDHAAFVPLKRLRNFGTTFSVMRLCEWCLKDSEALDELERAKR